MQLAAATIGENQSGTPIESTPHLIGYRQTVAATLA